MLAINRQYPADFWKLEKRLYSRCEWRLNMEMMMARDTASDWKSIGESEPWYGVLSAPKFLSANLNQQAKDEFYAQGVEDIDWAFSQIKSADPSFSPGLALDFGSGLGRLSFAMAAKSKSVLGVDVAPAMRAEAGLQKILRDIPNVEFRDQIPANQKFDWINSYIVFQHIVPSTGYAIIRDLLACLNPGGWTSLQLTFAHDFRDWNGLHRDAYAYRYDGEMANILEFNETQVGEMSMYDYDLNTVLFIFVRSGITNIKLEHTDHGGIHGFWIFGKK
jgi:SAM-dependent methyltransferase